MIGLKFPVELRLILAGQRPSSGAAPGPVTGRAGGRRRQLRPGGLLSRPELYACDEVLRRKIRQQPGCRALLSTEITRIEVADGKARSVTTAQGEQFSADYFLFDGDARLSLDLIGAEHFPKAFRKKLQYEYGPSVLSVYLGLENIDLRKYGFGEANMFWHPKVDLNEVYDDQLTDHIPDRPYFFCNAPTLRSHDAVLAPPGCDQLVMVAPCSYGYFHKLREQKRGRLSGGEDAVCRQLDRRYGSRVYSRLIRSHHRASHW